MKLLSDIIENIKVLETHGNLDVLISNLSLSSKDIENSSLFVAIVGNVHDGHIFIEDSIRKGAKVIVYQNNLESFEQGVTYIKVEDTKDVLGIMASNFYGNPSRALQLVGVTGTNGKTTTTTLLHQLFRDLKHEVGLIGTVVNKINDDLFDAIRTTPDPITLNKLLREMVDAGCTYCFMEVSSHAVSEKRISGLTFSGGVFTNLTHDHLDYHGTFENYRDAKKGFFDMLPESAFTLSNKDDANGEYMLQDSKAHRYFYSLKNNAEFTDRLETKLIGEFNSYNTLAVYATAILLKQDEYKVKEIIKNLNSVEGRFQYIKNNKDITGIVDYAHTPDALQNVLKTVTAILFRQDLKSGKIISVIGCGGDRDTTKRPIMARIAYDMSDIVILTSDNPRTENPDAILEDMKKGLPSEDKGGSAKVYIILDRREAIGQACRLANEGDYVLIAGKGHEKYQEIDGVKNHFDDMEELKKALQYEQL